MNKFTKIKDFHGSRLMGVGSSDIPVLAGLLKNYGATTMKLWEEKTGRRDRWEGNTRTEWGNKLEGIVLAEFIKNHFGEDAADRYMRYKRRGMSYGNLHTNTSCTHPVNSFCLAHADLVITEDEDEPVIIEAKTAGMMSGKRREGKIFTGYDPDDLTSQGIPDSVFLQVQWQMYVYGIKKAYVCVLIDTSDYREYGPIDADVKVQEKCLALAEQFWRLIETDQTPQPETWDDVQSLYPYKTDTTAIVAGDNEIVVREMKKRDKKLMAEISDREDERKEIKNSIGVLLGGNMILSSQEGEILAKQSEVNSETVSLSMIKKEAPEIEKQLREKGLINKSQSKRLTF